MSDEPTIAGKAPHLGDARDHDDDGGALDAAQDRADSAPQPDPEPAVDVPLEEGPRRRVLLAAGLIGGVLFLWMLFRPIPHEDRGTAPARPAGPDVEHMASDADPGWMRSSDTASGRGRFGGAPVPPVFGDTAQRIAPPPPDSAAARADSGRGATAGETAQDPRREAYRAALRSKPLASAAGFAVALPAASPGDSAQPFPSYDDMAAAADSVASQRSAPSGDPRGVASGQLTPRGGETFGAASSYLTGGGGQPRAATPQRLAPLGSAGDAAAGVLAIGTVIEGQLVVPINSDLPGSAIGVVTRPVFDAQQRREVIPAGSWLYGTYESSVAAGQARLVLQWTAIRFPDGLTYELPALRAGDGTGASGIPGRVNNHYGSLFGHALLSSVIAAGFAGTGSRTDAQGTTRGQAIGDAAAAELGQTAAQVTRRDLSIKPTITVPRLTRFSIILDRELAFLPPRAR